MTQEGPGLRERKKLRTREAIVDAATRLFELNGYDATTIADIAAEADIAPRTFFAYFPAKEDVVFDDFDDQLAGFAARLADREPGETAMDAMRGWIAGLVAAEGFQDERGRCRARIVHATPELRHHKRVLMARFEAVLADAVADDLGAEPGSLRPVLVASAATAVLGKLGDLDDDSDGAVRPVGGEDPLAVIDEALVFLSGGIAALQGKPSVPEPAQATAG